MSGRDKFGGRRGKPRKINGASGKAKGGRSIVAAEKPKRNAPCPCGSGRKFKKCHGAPPPAIPKCSVRDCDEPVKFFLQPSVDGQRSDSQYWVSCEGHVQDISASAAAHGMDVDVVPFNSIAGRTIARDGLDVVREPILPETETDSGEA